MAGEFKIADAFVEIKAQRDDAKKGIAEVDKRLKDLDDRTVKIGADDQARPIIAAVDREGIDDKIVKIDADDQASADLVEVKSTEIPDKEFLVDADTGKAASKIKDVSKTPPTVVVPADAETGKARQALSGLADLGPEVGDQFTGGMASGMMGGIAGIVATVGGALASGIAEKISEGNQIQRALELQFKLDPSVSKQYADLFDTNILEDFNNWVQNTGPFGEGADKTIRALGDMGIGADQLSTNMVVLSRTFGDFNKMGVADQRALTVEMTKVAAAAGIDVPAALKGATTAARVWGLSGWDATRLIGDGFQKMDARGDDWAETLNEYSPFFQRFGIDGSTALRLVSTGLDHGARNTDILADSFKEMSLRVVDGSTMTRSALLDLGLDAEKTIAAFGRGGPEAKAALDSVIDKLNQVQDPVERNRLGVALMGTQWEDAMRDVLGFIDVMPGTTKALDSAGFSSRIASEKAKGLSDAYTALKQPFESAAKTAGLVTEALDRMNERTPTLRDTTQAWNDLLREFTKQVDWDEAKGGVQRLSGALVDIRGEVNTTTEAGSKLEDWASRSKDAFMAQAGALREAGVPADQMTSKLQVMREEFIRNAQAQGLPKEAAIRLANAYGLVPNQVSTAIYAPGLLERMTELGMLGQKIVTLPDGRFSVTGDDSPARSTITKLITDFQGRVITLRVTGNTFANQVVRNAAGGMGAMAEGGPIVGPGTGTSDDIPLMGSNGEWMIREKVASKNTAFLKWFNRYGDTHPIPGFADGGPIGGGATGPGQSPAPVGVTNIYVTPPPQLDYELIAAKVSRTLELSRKGG